MSLLLTFKSILCHVRDFVGSPLFSKALLIFLRLALILFIFGRNASLIKLILMIATSILIFCYQMQLLTFLSSTSFSLRFVTQIMNRLAINRSDNNNNHNNNNAINIPILSKSYLKKCNKAGFHQTR